MVLAFTVLGGVIFGIGPALAAAFTLTRRYIQGYGIRTVRDFATIWRRELFRGTAVMLPVLVVTMTLWSNYSLFTGLGPDASAARLATLAALVVLAGIAAYVGPMYAHFDLPLRMYAWQASRFALAYPASTIILLFVLAATTFVTAVFPVLLLTISAGAWIYLSTWLCLRFFAENDAKLADQTLAGPPADQRILPAEPLRIH
ncbi:DUF624 domain-containing protein [Phytoactinopolyspora sp. XMNu-373]|uniref:DUF624 domain-containing protein n=1 Tax=Phytoactinopolyspora mesophila TaxID=2650750 RepID=A0A7K3MBR8_9ACTN|nr:DUF624 domain-containing protein [Phytoactinopolyspora mesophila]